MNRNFAIIFGLLCTPFLNAQTDSAFSLIPTVGGVVNVRYQYDELEDFNRFDLRRARIDVQGKAKRTVDYRVLGEFGTGGARLLNAHIRWQFRPNIALLAGQYKLPFTMEGAMSSADLEMIDFSLPITNLANYNDRLAGISASGRDIGLSLVGNLFQRDGYSLVNYNFGIFNGNGINVIDSNKNKDFSGLLTVNPCKHISIALSHYNGTAGPDGSTFRRNRTSIGARYNDGKFLLRSEYLWGETGTEKSEGVYVVAGYFVRPKIQLTARYDTFERDVNMPDNSTMQQNYTVGFNYLSTSRAMFQLNYTRKVFSKEAGDYFVAQMWIRF